MKVRTHVLRDIHTRVTAPLPLMGWRDFVGNADWKRNLVAVTNLLWHPARKRLICGLTAFDTDIMYEYDPADEKFYSLNYPDVSEKFEIKIHRSLVLAHDGGIYGATACVHREDQHQEAPGGRIFHYDFNSRSFEFLGTPIPHAYIQTICVDERRGLIYGVTYPTFEFFVFDMRRRETRYWNFVGSVPHLMAMDDDGCVWSTWSLRMHNLFKYDPDRQRMVFYDHGLLPALSTVGILYPGQGPIDVMLNGGDGFLYVGLASGDLVRIHPKTGEAEYLGRPLAQPRMSALQAGPDGRLWGIAGCFNNCFLFAYNSAKRSFEIVGQVKDSQTGLPLYLAHDMVFAPEGRLYVGEADAMDRAGYLWEVNL